MTPRVPLVDLTPWLDGSDPAGVARAVDDACRESGFLLVTGHGVPSSTPAAVRAAARRFFALDARAKAPYRVAVGGRGWLPPGAEANAALEAQAGPPDLKESWSAGADRPVGDPELDAVWFLPNVWPDEVPGLRDAAGECMTALRGLADLLLEIGATALGLDPDHFTRHTGHLSYTFNVNRYPPLTEVGPPTDGQFRIGPHTDFGTLTVLDREPGTGGLQIDLPGHGWVDAPYVEGAFTVNVGDLLAHWTGGHWRSARHRVLPPQAVAPEEDLVSLVYFHELDPDAVVAPLGARAAPVRAHDYLAQRYAAITVSADR